MSKIVKKCNLCKRKVSSILYKLISKRGIAMKKIIIASLPSDDRLVKRLYPVDGNATIQVDRNIQKKYLSQ